MKYKALCIVATAAMALTACRFSINSDRLDADYFSEADVHEWMAQKEYDAALMTQTGDTQRVVYLRFGSDTVFFNENYSGRDSSHMANSHLLTAYLVMDDKAASREVALSPLNDTTLRIDSATSLLLARPTKGREEELAHFAAWSLYGFRDALNASISDADDMSATEQELETAAQELETAAQEMEEMSHTLVDFDTVIVAPGCKAQEGFERLRKKALAAGFGSIEIRHRPGHHGCTFSCTHALGGGADGCYGRMEEMTKAAANEHLASTVRHNHGLVAIGAKCSFEAHH